MAIRKENLCTKYFPFTYKQVALNEKPPITKENLCIFSFIIGRVECIYTQAHLYWKIWWQRNFLIEAKSQKGQINIGKKSQYSLNFCVMLSDISYLDLNKNLNGMPLDNKYCTCMQISKLFIAFKYQNFSYDSCI